MDEEGNSWNVENVNTFFEPAIAEQILQIPISSHAGADFACWPFTRHGAYIVRSGYNLARHAKFFHTRSKARGLSSGWLASDKQWKAIWKIRAPGKMKIHLWRFSHDCLPSGVQLRKRQVPEAGTCVFCGRTEGIDHALLACQFAQLRHLGNGCSVSLIKPTSYKLQLWQFAFGIFGKLETILGIRR
jgi:hypothetical protein